MPPTRTTGLPLFSSTRVGGSPRGCPAGPLEWLGCRHPWLDGPLDPGPLGAGHDPCLPPALTRVWSGQAPCSHTAACCCHCCHLCRRCPCCRQHHSVCRGVGGAAGAGRKGADRAQGVGSVGGEGEGGRGGMLAGRVWQPCGWTGCCCLTRVSASLAHCLPWDPLRAPHSSIPPFLPHAPAYLSLHRHTHASKRTALHRLDGWAAREQRVLLCHCYLDPPSPPPHPTPHPTPTPPCTASPSPPRPPPPD